MFHLSNKYLLSFSLLIFSFATNADDIDILNEEPMTARTNVLFIMDVSKSMDWDTVTDNIDASPASGSRLNILKDSLATLLADSALDDINIGLSSFSGNIRVSRHYQTGHGITFPVSPIDDDAETILDQNPLFDHPSTSYFPATAGMTARDYLQKVSNTSWNPHGGTPIVDALYEAALYFRGLPVKWGRYDPSEIRGAHPSSYVGLIANQTTINVGSQSSRSTVDIPGRNCTPYTNVWGYCSLENTTVCNALPNLSNCTLDTGNSCYTPCGGSYDEFGNCLNPQAQVCNPYSTIWCDRQDYICDSISVAPAGVATYKSPIVEKCPANGIILLSDGAPSTNNSATLASTLMGGAYSNNCDSNAGEGRCGPELASFLAGEDNSTSIVGKQTIKTFTIGLALGNNPNAADYLKALALAGDGAYVNASSSAGLVKAFKSAILGIADNKARSFSSPSYSVDTSTRLSNGNAVYVPVFDRGGGGIWPGNLKKYELKNGELYGFNTGGVKVKATDATGNLKEDIKDLWATTTSTHAVRSGGAANKLPSPSARKAYTDVGVSTYPAILSSYKLDKSNSSITTSLLDSVNPLSMQATYRNKILDFIRGKNIDGTTRYHMGDTIHSVPVQLIYKSGNNNKTAVFIGTNEGFLHGFDGGSGSELFAFMPKGLIKNIKNQYESILHDNHTYGVDGSMTLWLDETGVGATKDGILDSLTEKAYLFFGLRRGGKSYYALDVTNPSSPKLLWRKDNSNLSGLGFSWSRPTLARLKYKLNDTFRTDQVLVFGGGYVDDHAGEAVDSGTGANVFIINAKTGARIFDVSTDVTTVVPSGSSLSHAIPSDIRVLDLDRNGSIDRLYFGDTGGNIWRVDLNANSLDPYNLANAQLTKLASLGGSGVNNRMFFAEPDTAIFKSKGNYVLSLSVGSGDRTKPLGPFGLRTPIPSVWTNEYFVTLFDENIFNVPPASFLPITPSKLVDAPANINLIGHANKKGWKLNLNPVPANPSSSVTGLSGEKVLSKAVTFRNMVLFTSFGIDSVVTTTMNEVTCAVVNKNKSRFYALDILTGKAGLDLSGDNSISDTADSSVEITSGEIAGSPKVVFNDFQASDGGACTKDDCIRTYEIRAGRGSSVADEGTAVLNPIPVEKNLPRVYWVDQEK